MILTAQRVAELNPPIKVTNLIDAADPHTRILRGAWASTHTFSLRIQDKVTDYIASWKPHLDMPEPSSLIRWDHKARAWENALTE